MTQLRNPDFADKDFCLYAVLCGAGARFQNEIWMSPSPSKFLAGCAFPYSEGEVSEFLGFTPERYVSRENAIDLAMAAFVRACRDNVRLRSKRTPIGLAVTAAVASASSPARRGGHRIHAAVMTPTFVRHVEIQLPKDAGITTRTHDGETTDAVAMELLRHALGFPGGMIWHVGESPCGGDTFAPNGGHGFSLAPTIVPEAEVMDRIMALPLFDRGRRLPAQLTPGYDALYPGNFNPLHDSHRYAADYVEENYDKRVVFNICATPPHKPALTAAQLLERVAMFELENWGHGPRALLISRGDALYLDKIERNPGVDLILGSDALQRMLDPQYGDSMATLGQLGTKMQAHVFVVSRKVNGKVHDVWSAVGGKGMSCNHVDDLFVSIPGYWCEESSTAIREAGLSPLTLG